MVLDGLSTGTGLITAGDTQWTDYTVTTVGKLVTGTAYKEMALVVRFQDTDHFYWMGLGCFRHKYSIAKMSGPSTYQELAYSGSDADIAVETPYTIQARVIGNLLQLYIDGALVLEYADPTPISNGAIGVRIWNSHIQLNYVEAEADGISPIQGDASIVILALGAGLSLITAEPLPLIAAAAYVFLTRR